MADDFKYDVFLSHSSKDKKVVRALAERLRSDGLSVWFDESELKPGDSIPAKIEEGLEHSRVLVLCMSANAFGSDWAQLEAGTFRFRDPLNKDRRFIPLRLDKAAIKGSLAQFLYINWLPKDREQEYAKLLEACRSPAKPPVADVEIAREQAAERSIELDHDGGYIRALAFSPDGQRAVSGEMDGDVRLWDLMTGLRLKVLKGHGGHVNGVAWRGDQHYILSSACDSTVRLWDVEEGSCLRVFEGHAEPVWSVRWSADQKLALSGSWDNTLRVWNIETGHCLQVLRGHTDRVWHVAWSADQLRALSSSDDKTIRLWDLLSGRCLRVFEGHTDVTFEVTWSVDGLRALSASRDRTLRVWDVKAGRCIRVLGSHGGQVANVAWSADQRHALSGSADQTVRLWDVDTGRCLRVLKGHTANVRTVVWSDDQRRAFSGDENGGIRVWDLSELVTEARAPEAAPPVLPPPPDQVQYTNAKVLLVGETSSGKTGLSHRLATGEWKPSDASTVGAWSTQWKPDEIAHLPLKDDSGKADPGVEREIWLWDFGGQADQRLIHQLYMDRAALLLLLFNSDVEDVLPGLRDWQTALRRCVPDETPQFLVAGRIDTGFKASRTKIQKFAKEHGLEYFETSSLAGTGCQEIRKAIMTAIPWHLMERRTSPVIFKRIKDAILQLRDKGRILHTYKELRELLWRALEDEDERFTDETLRTVVGLLDGPGVVKELDYGTYILLQPEWVNSYAQAVIRTLRSAENELGSLPIRSIAEGKLIYQSVGREGKIEKMKRLPRAEERVVLGEMERQLLERGLCLQQGNKLVFPSHCGRDRPTVQETPAVFVSYAVKGYLDDIYATLVVKLADSESFELEELWRDAADFDTLDGGHRMGVKLTRSSANIGDITVYFGKGVTREEQVIFANYIHAHLEGRSEEAIRLRHYVCPKCLTPKGNARVLMKKLLEKKREADTECDACGERFPLWDAMEKRFASRSMRERVEGLRAEDAIRLDARRKGKLLVLDVGARITSADQKWHEIPQEEDEGIDIVLEFTENDGRGSGKHLYLQLKAGNSHLKKRKSDAVEIFRIKKQSWVKYWLKQPGPVMLVIGTFAGDVEPPVGQQKLEFEEVRWMEISSYLKRESGNGTKPVRQIEFKGERLDMTSVHYWRKKVLKAGSD